MSEENSSLSFSDRTTQVNNPIPKDPPLSNEEYYDYSDRVLYLDSISVNCWKYISPILLIVGVVGNILSILVLRR